MYIICLIYTAIYYIILLYNIFNVSLKKKKNLMFFLVVNVGLSNLFCKAEWNTDIVSFFKGAVSWQILSLIGPLGINENFNYWKRSL